MDNVSGRIFNIQRFSVHDGPGIRTIIFFKGCRLACRWCCNPESQSYEIQTITENGKEKQAGRDVTVAEVMDETLKDTAYYRRSGGGITLSGGECLCQPEFCAALLKASAENGINTAVESAGYADFSVIEPILEYLDLFLMDIKHINGSKHKAFTTKSNELILENAEKIARKAKRLIIRVPVIPTFNDTVPEITGIARFAKSLAGVEELHLLPYHCLGTDKYAGLNREYTMPHIEPPSDGHMKKLLEAVLSTGIKGQIGG
jgi:pyruvate formate lyase activating enzyme